MEIGQVSIFVQFDHVSKRDADLETILGQFLWRLEWQKSLMRKSVGGFARIQFSVFAT